MTDLQAVFQSSQALFDDTIQRLPASANLLAKIKSEYDEVLKKLQTTKDRVAMQEVRGVLQTTQVASMSNYYKRIQELELQLENIEMANKRINLKMEAMRLEKESIPAGYVERVHKMHQEQMEKSKIGAHQPNISLSDSLSIGFLQDYLAKLELELQEAKEITDKKYITDKKWDWLQNRLKQKEKIRTNLISENRTLSLMVKRLEMANQAVQSYLSYLEAHRLDQTQFPLDHYIQAVIRKHSKSLTSSSSEEEAEDPVKEMEAEMILDSYEMFNKLFGAEKYQEAALLAATSPKGVLRTIDTLVMFRDSARQQAGEKLPLLVYVDHLLQCAPAYEPISLQESLECAHCLIQQGEVNQLTYWIAQACLPPSVELGTVISGGCSCSSRCTCRFQNLAFRVFNQSRAYPQACKCLVLLGQMVAFLSYASSTHMTVADYGELLGDVASTELALVLTAPPPPHRQIFTIFEVMYILLTRETSEERGKVVEAYLLKYTSKTKTSLAEYILWDNNTGYEIWEHLPTLLYKSGQAGIALEILAEMQVQITLSICTKEFNRKPSIYRAEKFIRPSLATPTSDTTSESETDTSCDERDSD